MLDLDSYWGDRRYNQAYFGVTPVQSNRSRFATFTAGSGLYAYSMTGTWNHSFAPHWSTSLSISALRYADNASGSPLVRQRNFVSVTTAVTYKY